LKSNVLQNFNGDEKEEFSCKKCAAGQIVLSNQCETKYAAQHFSNKMRRSD